MFFGVKLLVPGSPLTRVDPLCAERLHLGTAFAWCFITDDDLLLR